MLIAISQRAQLDKHSQAIDVLESNYVRYLEKFGVKVLPIPNATKDVEYYFENFPIGGLILSGGENVDPRLYGQEGDMHDEISIRDLTEKKLLDLAIERKIPVLGICRGMQFINVYFWGKLVEGIGERDDHPSIREHSVLVNGKEFRVNSYHNMGVDVSSLSLELKAWAVCGKVVEGLYHPSLPIMGIQWHPERTSPDELFNKKILALFLKGATIQGGEFEKE